ncbi:ribose 5-phosphate isomerase A, partial [bacterium]
RRRAAGHRLALRVFAGDLLDVHDLVISDAVGLETRINQITGVVTVGLFASRPADLLLLAGPGGVREMTAAT